MKGLKYASLIVVALWLFFQPWLWPVQIVMLLGVTTWCIHRMWFTAAAVGVAMGIAVLPATWIRMFSLLNVNSDASVMRRLASCPAFVRSAARSLDGDDAICAISLLRAGDQHVVLPLLSNRLHRVDVRTAEKAAICEQLWLMTADRQWLSHMFDLAKPAGLRGATYARGRLILHLRDAELRARIIEPGPEREIPLSRSEFEAIISNSDNVVLPPDIHRSLRH